LCKVGKWIIWKFEKDYLPKIKCYTYVFSLESFLPIMTNKHGIKNWQNNPKQSSTDIKEHLNIVFQANNRRKHSWEDYKGVDESNFFQGFFLRPEITSRKKYYQIIMQNYYQIRDGGDVQKYVESILK
jgi:c-di-GMP-related signal transduction protein